MKIRHKTPPPQFRGFIAGVIVASFVCNAMQPVTASVGDNLDSAFTVLAEALGIGKESSVPEEDKFETASLIEKINYLEEQLDNQNKDFDVKLNNQTAALQESIEESAQAANAAYSLYVYIPKTEALADYSGQQVKITSSSGNQSATAVLRDDGTNYSTTLYFNFNDDCKLSYNLLNSSRQEYAINNPVTIAVTGQEQGLFTVNTGANSLSWTTIHNILQSNNASNFGLTTEGTMLPDNWYVIGSGVDDGTDTLRIWKKDNIQYDNWSTVNTTATEYWNEFNSKIAKIDNIACNSGLLSKSDVEAGWLESNRINSCWLETEYIGGGHWYVDIGGSVRNAADHNRNGCAPYVWIH